MNEDIFWEIIEKYTDTEEMDDYPETLIHQLKKLEPKQIIEFNLFFYHFNENADTSELYAACILLNGGATGDDGFRDFRSWLISRGRTVYEKALADPDSLVSIEVQLIDGRPYAQWETFAYAAFIAYEELTGRGLIEDEQAENISINVVAIELKEEIDLPFYYTLALVEKKLPKLWQKYSALINPNLSPFVE